MLKKSVIQNKVFSSKKARKIGLTTKLLKRKATKSAPRSSVLTFDEVFDVKTGINVNEILEACERDFGTEKTTASTPNKSRTKKIIPEHLLEFDEIFEACVDNDEYEYYEESIHSQQLREQEHFLDINEINLVEDTIFEDY